MSGLTKLKLYQGPSGPELRGDDGDVLTYEAASESWVPAAASGGSLPLAGIVQRAGTVFFGGAEADELTPLSGVLCVYAGSPEFALVGEDASAPLRYTGPPITVLVRVDISTGNHGAPVDPALAIALNDDVIGAGGDRLDAGIQRISNSTTVDVIATGSLSAVRRIALESGDDILAAVGSATGGGWPINGYSMTVQQVPADPEVV